MQWRGGKEGTRLEHKEVQGLRPSLGGDEFGARPRGCGMDDGQRWERGGVLRRCWMKGGMYS